jgi:hypothetical protein
MSYIGKPIGGTSTLIIDTPGIGDQDITAMKLLALLEMALAEPLIGGIDAVVVTNKILDNRLKLGAQVVHAMVDMGFQNPDKWESIILCGTKSDRATADDAQSFSEEIVPEFYKGSGSKATPVMVSWTDYGQLYTAIENVPNTKLEYVPPPARNLADKLAATMGLEPGAFASNLAEMRQNLKEQSQQIEKTLEEMAAKSKELQDALDKSEQELQGMQNKIDELQAAAQKAVENKAPDAPDLSNRPALQKQEHERRMKAEDDAATERKLAFDNQMKNMAMVMKKKEEEAGTGGGLLGIIGGIAQAFPGVGGKIGPILQAAAPIISKVFRS